MASRRRAKNKKETGLLDRQWEEPMIVSSDDEELIEKLPDWIEVPGKRGRRPVEEGYLSILGGQQATPCSSGSFGTTRENDLSTPPSMAVHLNVGVDDGQCCNECEDEEDAQEVAHECVDEEESEQVNEFAVVADAVENVDELVIVEDDRGGDEDEASVYEQEVISDDDALDDDNWIYNESGVHLNNNDEEMMEEEEEEMPYRMTFDSNWNTVVLHFNDSDYEDDNEGGVVLPWDALLLPHQDVDAGLKLSNRVSRICENFKLRLMRLKTQYQTMNREFWTDLLKVIGSMEPADLLVVPRDYRTLQKCIPVKSLSCWISHICFTCEKKIIYKFHMDARDEIPFPRCLCNNIIDYNVDHFVVADVSEVLSLVLPSIWKWRKQEYLPPYIQKLMMDNHMDFEKDITITVSSDGVNFFKSSSLSVWPIMGFIDGLPYHLQRKTIFLLGALAARGVGKYFQVNCMMDDFVKQVKRLNKFKFSWMFKGEVIKTRVLVSRVIADSPARAALQGISNFNGACGCNFCHHIQTGLYYDHFEQAVLPRTDERMRFICALPDFDSMTIRDRTGIRWKSSFMSLPMDLVHGFPPDVMHSVYQGVMKLLIEQWLSKPVGTGKDGKKLPLKPYQLTQNQRDILDWRLVHIRPPDRAGKPPREISKFGMWKAHELSMFLLYYGPIVLEGILKKKYYDHYIQLVCGIALLSLERSEERVVFAQEYLDNFSREIGEIYHKKCYRFNVHLLRHLPKAYQLHGRLPLFSMYPFESENHRYSKYVHGSNAVVMQMLKKSMHRLFLNCHEDAFDKCNRSEGWLDKECRDEAIDASEIRDLDYPCGGGKYYQVYHPPKGGPRIVSKAYSALRCRNSYTVMLDNKCVASVLKYFVASKSNEISALVEELEVVKLKPLGHIWYLSKSLGKRVVPVTSFVEQVVEVKCGRKVGFAVFLNNIEHVAE